MALFRAPWLFLYNRKLPQQKPFQGRMRSILVIAAAERRFFTLRETASGRQKSVYKRGCYKLCAYVIIKILALHG